MQAERLIAVLGDFNLTQKKKKKERYYIKYIFFICWVYSKILIRKNSSKTVLNLGKTLWPLGNGDRIFVFCVSLHLPHISD